jgi:hypothetical protein
MRITIYFVLQDDYDNILTSQLKYWCDVKTFSDYREKLYKHVKEIYGDKHVIINSIKVVDL